MEVNEVIQSIGGLSYWGVAFIGLIANAFPLAPEEIILLAVGYLTGTGAFNIWIVIPIMIAGMFTSDIILFYLSRRGGKLITRLKSKIKGNKRLQDDNWVKNHVKKIIFISRFIVYFRWIGPVLSGGVKTKWETFLFYDFIALCVYVPTVLFTGNYFHNYLSAIVKGVGVFKDYFLLAVGLIVLIIFIRFLSKRFLKDITKTVTDYVPTIIPGLSKKNNGEEND
ncbi:DedA family protein [Candidatus Parcubacteria bacterium]|nr:DedA family protein [Candidatus Parcubacteria bacterium]